MVSIRWETFECGLRTQGDCLLAFLQSRVISGTTGRRLSELFREKIGPWHCLIKCLTQSQHANYTSNAWESIQFSIIALENLKHKILTKITTISWISTQQNKRTQSQNKTSTLSSQTNFPQHKEINYPIITATCTSCFNHLYPTVNQLYSYPNPIRHLFEEITRRNPSKYLFPALK